MTRTSSAATYGGTTENNVPDDVTFRPIIDHVHNFAAPNIDLNERARRNAIAMQNVVYARDTALAGVTMVPGDPLQPDQKISVFGNKPLICRDRFKQVGRNYLDMLPIFVKIRDGQIVDSDVLTFQSKHGNNTKDYASHTGDLRPWRISPSDICHEVVCGQIIDLRTDGSNMNQLVQVRSWYEETQLARDRGFNAVIFVLSAYPKDAKINEMSQLEPTFIVHTHDTNDNVVGYTVDCQLFTREPSVIVGAVSLMFENEGQFHVLGIPTAGFACLTQPIVDTMKTELNRNNDLLRALSTGECI
jgi:hypothetical protein